MIIAVLSGRHTAEPAEMALFFFLSFFLSNFALFFLFFSFFFDSNKKIIKNIKI
jgi:hypothetical protein